MAVKHGVPSGTMANYQGPAPTKEEDDYYTYMFTGWSPAQGQVTHNITYTAQFTGVAKTYTVTWKKIDGIILSVNEEVVAGTYVTYDGPALGIYMNPTTGYYQEFDC